MSIFIMQSPLSKQERLVPEPPWMLKSLLPLAYADTPVWVTSPRIIYSVQYTVQAMQVGDTLSCLRDLKVVKAAHIQQQVFFFP